MLATIWHEIVKYCWFLTISQDLRNMITKLILFWFSYQCRTILWSHQTRTGKKPEINKKCHVKSWLKYQNNRSVSWRLSCTYKQKVAVREWRVCKSKIHKEMVEWPNFQNGIVVLETVWAVGKNVFSKGYLVFSYFTSKTNEKWEFL